MRRTIHLMLCAAAFACAPPQSEAQPPGPSAPAVAFTPSGVADYDAWRADFALRAIALGRDPAVVQRLLEGTAPEQAVIDLDRNQPEFTRPPWDYIERGASPTRIATGTRLRGEYAQVFADVEGRYGVDADIIAGIWGVETNFGTFPLTHDAAEALATLAFEGRRRSRFEGYLLSLIEMVEKGYAGPAELKSSWAGAMGQPQFMPDIYLAYAVDWNGDGRRDIWTTTGDVLASIANYLRSRGWRPGEPVFTEVRLAPGFDYALADETRRPLAAWLSAGATPVADTRAAPDLEAELWLPAGASGPALLLFPNFEVIKAYNSSDRYALTVALLARGFEGRVLLEQSWPKDQGALDRAGILEVQTLLAARGYDPGPADGMFGANTRRAVRAYQIAMGLPADGFPTPALLSALKSAAPPLMAPASPAPPATAPASVAETAAPAPEPEPEPEPAAEKKPRPRGRSLTVRQVRQLQTDLRALGFLQGRADGDAGPRTSAAIRAFEAAEGFEETGRADTFILARARAAARRSPP